MVSAIPSSDPSKSTGPASSPGVVSGIGLPRETRAATSSSSVDLPTPGSPSSTVSEPRGMYPFHSQLTATAEYSDSGTACGDRPGAGVVSSSWTGGS